MDLRKSLEDKVSDYAFKDFVVISMTDSISSVAKAMLKAGAGEALIVQDGEAIGIVTERDILFKVVAAGVEPSSTQAQHVMSAPVEGIDDEATVGDAIARMSNLGVRRLVVRKGKKVLGLITQKRLVAGGANAQVVLPELATPRGVSCPYCSAVLADAKELSKHIDQLHVGEGLLKGDRRKW